MAEIDDLLTQVDDEGLRSQLKASIDNLRRQLRFGLVFERHLPESIRAYNARIQPLDTVQIRAELRLFAVSSGLLSVRPCRRAWGW